MKSLIFLGLVSLLTGCAAKAPDVESCIVVIVKKDLENSYGECTLKTGDKVKRKIGDLHKYIAFPYEDGLSYMRYCRGK